MTINEAQSKKPHVAPGQYKAVCTQKGFVQFESKDGPVIKFGAQFKLLEGTDTGKRVTWLGGFSGKGREFSTRCMKAMGWDGVTDPRAAPMDKEVYVTIRHEADFKDPSRIRAVVEFVNPLDDDGGGVISRFKANAATEDAFVRGLLAGVAAEDRAKNGAAPAATARPSMPPDDFGGSSDRDDGSLPF